MGKEPEADEEFFEVLVRDAVSGDIGPLKSSVARQSHSFDRRSVRIVKF